MNKRILDLGALEQSKALLFSLDNSSAPVSCGSGFADPKKTPEDDDEAGDDSIGADIEEGRIIRLSEALCKAGKTAPPKSFTEDTLLSAMEKAGVKDTPEDGVL